MKELMLTILFALLSFVQSATLAILPENPTPASNAATATVSKDSPVATSTRPDIGPAPEKKRAEKKKDIQAKPSEKIAAATTTALVEKQQVEERLPRPTVPEQNNIPKNSAGTEIELEILALMNVEREKAGLLSLAPDTALTNIARGHSSDMLVNDYFSHEDKSGCSSSCRATNAGYSWQIVGENIYMMSGYELNAVAAAKMIVEGWMNSPGHRANILREAYTNVGVGVSTKGKDIYATSVYAKPRH
ncbi:CAP domain-containing protein [Candidatus Kaiserbacteria bacterium]|nr:CAP domain-containing protein [Candidatus Kaiserbacteria bacterium]